MKAPGRPSSPPRRRAAIYARVSTADKGQDVDVQVEPLVEYARRVGYEPVVFAEQGVSGASTSRPVLNAMMTRIRRREFAALIVWKIDRLGRSLQHLLQILQEVESRGATFHSYTEGMDTGTPAGKFQFEILGAVAEFERLLTRERVVEGLAHARAHGTKSGKAIGRPRCTKPVSVIVSTIAACGGNLSKAAERLGISRTTIRRATTREGLDAEA